MFSSKSKEQAQAAPPVPQATLAQQQKRSTRSPTPSTSTPSIISADLVVNGSLTSVGDIQIDGRVEGDVKGAALVIGDNALIHGEVCAEDLTVRGRIEGGIRARKVLLCSTCHVEGNILHEAFAVEAGAFFEGNCRHADDPLAEQPQRRSPDYASRPASAPSGSAPPNVAVSSSGLAAVARPLNDGGAGAARPAPATQKT